MPATDGFPADEAKLVSIFIQSILYGAFTVLFVGSIAVLRGKTGRTSMQKVLLGTALTMWIVATTHIAVNFTRIIEAFIIHRNDPGGPASYFNQLSNFTNLFGSALYLFQTLVGDGFVLYRSAVVWGWDYRIVAFPFLLLLGSTASAIGVLYSFAKTSSGVIFLTYLSHWIVSFFVLTLSTNLICTSLIACKIWGVNRFTEHVIAKNLRPVLLVVIESGAIYSATLITLLVCYLTGSWAQYLLLDAVSPIVGIVFSMVILRLGLRLTEADGTTVEFGKASTRTAIWNTNHTDGINLNAAVDKAKRVEAVKYRHRDSQTDIHGEDEQESSQWSPSRILSPDSNV